MLIYKIPLPESADVFKDVLPLYREYVVLSSYSLAVSNDDITDSHTLQFKFSSVQAGLNTSHVPASPSACPAEPSWVRRRFGSVLKEQIYDYDFPQFDSFGSSLSLFRSFSCCHRLPHLHCSLPLSLRRVLPRPLRRRRPSARLTCVLSVASIASGAAFYIGRDSHRISAGRPPRPVAHVR